MSDSKPVRPAHYFQPGQVANPKGRPKGTRNKVATAFFDNLYAIWEEQGEAVLRRAAFEKPMEFAAMVAKLMPAKLEISTPTQGLTDERFQELMELAERQLALSAEGANASVPAASMTIEGQAVEVEGGGGSPRVGLIAGEVIDVTPFSAPAPEPLLANQAPSPEPLPANQAPNFTAAPQATPFSTPAISLQPPPGPKSAPVDDEDIDPASLF